MTVARNLVAVPGMELGQREMFSIFRTWISIQWCNNTVVALPPATTVTHMEVGTGKNTTWVTEKEDYRIRWDDGRIMGVMNSQLYRIFGQTVRTQIAFTPEKYLFTDSDTVNLQCVKFWIFYIFFNIMNCHDLQIFAVYCVCKVGFRNWISSDLIYYMSVIYCKSKAFVCLILYRCWQGITASPESFGSYNDLFCELCC